jgi:hypothetical protein
MTTSTKTIQWIFQLTEALTTGEKGGSEIDQ